MWLGWPCFPKKVRRPWYLVCLQERPTHTRFMQLSTHICIGIYNSQRLISGLPAGRGFLSPRCNPQNVIPNRTKQPNAGTKGFAFIYLLHSGMGSTARKNKKHHITAKSPTERVILIYDTSEATLNATRVNAFLGSSACLR
jgi:hypothetical protein